LQLEVYHPAEIDAGSAKYAETACSGTTVLRVPGKQRAQHFADDMGAGDCAGSRKIGEQFDALGEQAIEPMNFRGA
jgi:hypothetical protein